jgi:lipoprotein signal peptidase
MYGIYAGALILIFWYLAKHFFNFDSIQAWAWILILAGALANIGERIVLGYVRDFIYIFNGIFNFADGYIILGIVLLLWNESHKAKPDRPDRSGS